MTPLSPRQRVKLSAALALIHDHGHDAKAVSRSVNTDIARGIDPKAASQRALREFAKGKPDIARALSHTLRLIDASDEATVTRYGEALDRYNQTGDPQAMASVAQTFVQDSIALAIQHGEISSEDAANPEAIAGAFGFPFAPGAAERVIAISDPQGAPGTPPAPASPATPAATPAAPEAPAGPSGFTGPGGWEYSAPAKDRSAAAFKPITGPENAYQGYSESNTYG